MPLISYMTLIRSKADQIGGGKLRKYGEIKKDPYKVSFYGGR